MIHGCTITLLINGKILHWFAFINLSRNILHKEAIEARITVLMLRAVIYLSLPKMISATAQDLPKWFPY